MRGDWKFFLLGLFVLGIPSPVTAITIETDEMRLGINGYLKVVYERMGRMAAVDGDGTGIETLSDTSTFENDTHLIFNAVKDRLRTNLNIEFHNGFVSEGEDVGGVNTTATRGEFLLLELFGEYIAGPYFQVRVGHFLAPFGIYNHIRYVTPLFAAVELPMIYESPENYGRDALVPDPANLMIGGNSGGEGEYVIDRAEASEDRFGYYVRLTFDAGRYAPFAAYDYLKENITTISSGMTRGWRGRRRTSGCSWPQPSSCFERGGFAG